MALDTFYAAVEEWNRRDVDAVFARLAPDLEFVSSGVFPNIPRRLRGEQIRSFFTDWLEAWETIRVEPLEVEERGARVLARIRFAARGREGVEVARQFYWLMKIDGERVVEWQSFASREEAPLEI